MFYWPKQAGVKGSGERREPLPPRLVDQSHEKRPQAVKVKLQAGRDQAVIVPDHIRVGKV